jgi:glycosyltransferase involved in cell wall biosynthesis
MSVRAAVRYARTWPIGAQARVRTRGWPPTSRLFVLGDASNWALDGEAKHLVEVAGRLGVTTAPPSWSRGAKGQAVFHTSHFDVWAWTGSSHRLGMSYFHGRPGTPGYPEFDVAHDSLRANAHRIDRVQVTHAEMHDLVLEAGVPPEHVFRIPIGIDLERFPLRREGDRDVARARFGLPSGAFVVGSFQKDGVGWGEGLEPKLIKGPDTLVKALVAARRTIPELHVLLTGPARGYVRRELESHRVPHTHVDLPKREDLSTAYHALDAYLVSSRQEGGPKGPLEAMASGVPVVSTRVGEVQELIAPTEGLLVDVEDVDGLSDGLLAVARGAGDGTLVAAARARVETVAHGALDPLWSDLLDGFVSRGTVV